MFIVSKAFIISSATVIVRAGGGDISLNTFVIYISSVYSPFSDMVGLPSHNTPFPGVLMKSIGAASFDRMPFLTSTTCVGCNIK